MSGLIIRDTYFLSAHCDTQSLSLYIKYRSNRYTVSCWRCLVQLLPYYIAHVVIFPVAAAIRSLLPINAAQAAISLS